MLLWEYGAPNQPVLDRCPRTAAVLAALPGARIPGRAPSAFFSLLKPRTRIPPHTGVTNTRAIVHLPLIVPPECGFRVGGETRSWVEGEAFAFDDTIEHEAWNDSDELRAVLIFDVWNPHLTSDEQSVIADYCALADRVTE
ncbi:aspartyl/asparaginyl beta-hydroxylase domain-containing protein [Sphingomonas sp. J344]|uniref:aspartyl/asparaginyl beta-hydroxylase domain-containing protein n=1 Tax=Sphingomonas sp. J344 TaxID=2898434 RepID=UPI002151A289|nr:aspartyl/asparaginyl beta-hydroxylase domain-containing protein [Sphingomonas sp. J344]MCR5870830.1 aspartyl/asparaginyl beta-hydroxylase domain-containing protein [Sphingomonas sp. J344]